MDKEGPKRFSNIFFYFIDANSWSVLPNWCPPGRLQKDLQSIAAVLYSILCKGPGRATQMFHVE